MDDEEDQRPKQTAQDHALKCTILGIVGFGLSVVFIVLGLMLLIRFWIFTNILYNLFFMSMLIVGVIFNISSINLIINDVTKSVNIRPFIYGTIVTLFWTVFAIILPCVKKGFYKEFKELPNPIDYSEFYDGEAALNRNISATTEIHPFVRRFMQDYSIFDHEVVILGFLFMLLIIQIVYWIHMLALYTKVKRDEALFELEGQSLKTL